ncbi:MAG TPA: DNA cytosine methyltransferase, partial [Candidatus Methanoperedens sp.]
ISSMNRKIRVVDLFCGCGGMTLGFQNAGFDVVAAFDNWESAIGVYRKNFKHKVFNLDLGNHNGDFEMFGRFHPEIIISGPPCQDFSHAGKRNEDLGRACLTVSLAEIVAALKPPFFVMENVDRAIKSKRYQTAKQIFKKSGYGLTERILDASLCGVPQKRKRLFVIGELGGEEDSLGKYFDANLSRKPMTVREHFEKQLGETLNFQYYYRHPRTYQRRAIYSIDEPSATIRGVNRPVPSTYIHHPADAAPPSENVKPLTTKQRSYIQTFPKEFIFEGSKSDVEQMIGNAVPVKLAEYVARCIIEYLEKKNKKTGQLTLF